MSNLIIDFSPFLSIHLLKGPGKLLIILKPWIFLYLAIKMTTN